MPITFDLNLLASLHGTKVYLETGMYNPEDLTVSLNQAMVCEALQKVYSIELRTDWVNNALKKYKKEIEEHRLRVIEDDSNNLLAHIKGNGDFTRDKTLFYLDAHVDGAWEQSGRPFVNRCPVFNELRAIQQLPRKDHVICVDDVRILKNPSPWFEESFGKVNFIEEIKSQILTINPEYQFVYLDGVIPGDVLCAFVWDKELQHNYDMHGMYDSYTPDVLRMVGKIDEAVQYDCNHLEEGNWTKLQELYLAYSEGGQRAKILKYALEWPVTADDNEWAAWRAFDELSVLGYYHNNFYAAKRAYERLREINRYPLSQQQRIENNAMFFR